VPVLEQTNGKKHAVVCEARRALCLRCGQCAALCPSDSIVVDGLAPEDYLPTSPHGIAYEPMLTLLRQRRSVRRYKGRPVPRAVLEQVIAAAAAAPALSGSGAIGVIAVDALDKLAALSAHTQALYRKLEKALGNPIARVIVKRRAGARKFHDLRDFAMPAIHWYLRWRDEGRGDEFRRDSPALLLFHCAVDEPAGDEACLLAAFHAVLAAETLGLGACINGLIPPVCNRWPAARALIGLPANREVFASLTLGYPKFHYRKAVPRRLAEVRYL
jgi:nitroreductase